MCKSNLPEARHLLTLLLLFCLGIDQSVLAQIPDHEKISLIPVWETDSPEMHAMHFREFTNGSSSKPSNPFLFQRWDEPQLVELASRLNLDSLIEDAPTEFEVVKRITLAVCNIWGHSWPIEYPSWNALEILDGVAAGNRYWCTFKQIVSVQALASAGIIARVVACNWHHSMEFWSNEYSKWIVMDAWGANYYSRNGVPLSALEIHKLTRDSGSLENKGVYEVYIKPARWLPERDTDSTLATESLYGHIRYISRNDFISAPLASSGHATADGYLYPRNQLNDLFQTSLVHVSWWQQGDAPSVSGPVVSDEREFNFPLNEVEISLLRRPGSACILDADFTTHTPGFETYLLRVDNQEWATCGNKYSWELQPGVNTLEVVTRNGWGRTGKISRAVIEFKPEEFKMEPVTSLTIPDAGFELDQGRGKRWYEEKNEDGWKLNFRYREQEPVFYSTVNEKPHSGSHCFKIVLNESGAWARLVSNHFSVNPASDVTLNVWMRADSAGRQATVYLLDGTEKGTGVFATNCQPVIVGTQWKRFTLKARLTARTNRLVAGVIAKQGSLWVDDFDIKEDRRLKLPW